MMNAISRHFTVIRSAAVSVLVLGLLPSAAWAHPFHFHYTSTGELSFTEGFVHPFIGVDHLAMMLAVGMIAALAGGKARLLLPMGFVACLSLGLIASLAGGHIASAELGVALSLIVAGFLLFYRPAVQLTAVLSITAAFGFFHGMLHGAELTAFSTAASFGLIVGTAVLHLVGFRLGMLLSLAPRRVAAYATSVAGGALLLQGIVLGMLQSVPLF